MARHGRPGAPEETATLVDHEVGFELYDADDSIVTSVGSWGVENKEPAPGEESVMEFFDGPVNDDIDFTQVESYVVVLTCDVLRAARAGQQVSQRLLHRPSDVRTGGI